MQIVAELTARAGEPLELDHPGGVTRYQYDAVDQSLRGMDPLGQATGGPS